MLLPERPLGSCWSEHSLIDYGRPLPTKILIVLRRKSSKSRIIGLAVGSGGYFGAGFISQGMELERVMEEKLTKQGRDWYSLGGFRDVGPM